MNTNLQKYSEWLRLNYDNANTIKTYFNVVRTFFQTNEELNQESLNAYFLFLIKKKKSASTFNLVKNSFINYFKFTKQTLEFPKYRKRDKPVNKYISKEEVQELINMLGGIFDKRYRKVELLIKIFFATGIRPNELLKLKRENINTEKGIIELLNTKGNRDRLVPLGAKLKKEIQYYFETDYERTNAFNIHKRTLEGYFIKINKYINPTLNINPRLLRHSCAVNMIRHGVDLFSVKNILGHSDIKITEIYAEPDFKHTKEIYNKCIKEL